MPLAATPHPDASTASVSPQQRKWDLGDYSDLPKATSLSAGRRLQSQALSLHDPAPIPGALAWVTRPPGFSLTSCVLRIQCSAFVF